MPGEYRTVFEFSYKRGYISSCITAVHCKVVLTTAMKLCCMSLETVAQQLQACSIELFVTK